jgi:MFS family permease
MAFSDGNGWNPELERVDGVSLATAAYLLIQPVAGGLADRYAMRTTVLLGLLVAALSIMAITFASGWILIVIVIAAGMGIGTVWTNSDALVSASASPSQIGASIGAAHSFKEFGDMVGPLLVGGLTQFFGVRLGFVTCGAAAVVLHYECIASGRANEGTSPFGGPMLFKPYLFCMACATAATPQMSGGCHPPEAVSNSCASARTMSSRHGLETICTPTGRLSGVTPQRTTAAGQPR